MLHQPKAHVYKFLTSTPAKYKTTSNLNLCVLFCFPAINSVISFVQFLGLIITPRLFVSGHVVLLSGDSLYVCYSTFPSVLELNRGWQLQLKYTRTISHQQCVLLIFERTQKHLALERFNNQISMLFHTVYIGSDDETPSEKHILLSLTDKLVSKQQ